MHDINQIAAEVIRISRLDIKDNFDFNIELVKEYFLEQKLTLVDYDGLFWCSFEILIEAKNDELNALIMLREYILEFQETEHEDSYEGLCFNDLL